jgi:hypothetical protein
VNQRIDPDPEYAHPESLDDAAMRRAVDDAVRTVAAVPTDVYVHYKDLAIVDVSAVSALFRRASALQRDLAAAILDNGGTRADIGRALNPMVGSDELEQRAADFLDAAPVLPDTNEPAVTQAVNDLADLETARVVLPAMQVSSVYADVDADLVQRLAEFAAAGGVARRLKNRLYRSAMVARGADVTWDGLAVLLHLDPSAGARSRAVTDPAGAAFDLIESGDGTVAWRCASCDERIREARPVASRALEDGHADDCPRAEGGR